MVSEVRAQSKQKLSLEPFSPWQLRRNVSELMAKPKPKRTPRFLTSPVNGVLSMWIQSGLAHHVLVMDNRAQQVNTEQSEKQVEAKCKQEEEGVGLQPHSSWPCGFLEGVQRPLLLASLEIGKRS